MNELFLKIINMSISASWLVLAVLILRLVLKKAPKWVNVLLWGIVAVRLICPFSFESALSLIPSSETIPLGIEMATNPAIDSGVSVINSMVNPVLSSFAPQQHVLTSANPLQIWIPIFSIIWLIGVAALLLYTAISYWRLRRKVDTAVRYKDNIFQSENVSSPFVLGIIKPRIYLPFHMNGQNLEHVVAHEQAHIHRKDHWWKPLGFLLLTIHWFNPLMWLAYVLLCRDIELACDEKVIKKLGNEQRADYTQALVACSVNRRMIAACPLAFGEVDVKERVKAVMNYKKPAFWIIVMAVLACMVVAVCFLTNPKEGHGYESQQDSSSKVRKWFDYTEDSSQMSYENELKIQLEEYPDITFRYTPYEIITTTSWDDSEHEGHTILISGMPIWNAYFADLTGDGMPELCSSLSMGSGMIDNRVIIFDYANGVSYKLEDRGTYDYYLRMDDANGCLYVDKKEYRSDNLVSSGKLVFKDGCIQLEGVTAEPTTILQAKLLEITNGYSKFYLTIGAEGVKSIELSTPNSSGGFENADGSLLKKGERIWLENLDGYSDLRGLTITARGENGEIIWTASVPDGDENKGFTHLVNDDWEITNIE